MKKHVLTLKGMGLLTELQYDGNTINENDINSLAIISGRTSASIKKMKPSQYAQLKTSIVEQSTVPGKPVYLVKYKGQIFGYSPAEIGTIEDMAAIEVLSKGAKWQALAAVMFRPCTKVSNFLNRKDSRYQKHLGVKVKYINEYHKDLLSYKCKGIDMNNIDLSFWDEFPFEILMSNLAFSLGSGVQFSLSIHPSSLTSKKIREQIGILQMKMRAALSGLVLHTIYPTLKSFPCTESEVPLSSHQEKLVSISSVSNKNKWKKLMLQGISEIAWVVTGDNNKHLIDTTFDSFDSFLKANKSSGEMLLIVSSMLKMSKLNANLSWFGLKERKEATNG